MTYGFIGLGLIGGSLAKNLKKLDPDCVIMAHTGTAATCRKALEEHVIDVICDSCRDASFAGCDMLFLCAPAEQNIKVLPDLKEVIGKNCLLTDVGSVKTPVHEAVAQLGLSGQRTCGQFATFVNHRILTGIVDTHFIVVPNGHRGDVSAYTSPSIDDVVGGFEFQDLTVHRCCFFFQPQSYA